MRTATLNRIYLKYQILVKTIYFFSKYCFQSSILLSSVPFYLKKVPTKHFLFSNTSWRCLEDVFGVINSDFLDVFMTSSRLFFFYRSNRSFSFLTALASLVDQFESSILPCRVSFSTEHLHPSMISEIK